MNAAISALVGDREQFAFEERIFHSVMLIAVLLTAVGAVLELFYGEPYNIPIDAFFLLCWAAAYHLSRVLGKFAVVSKAASLVLVFLFLPYLWVTTGGYHSGPMLCYTVLAVAAECIILNGRFRLAILLCMLAVVLGLLSRDTLLEAPTLQTADNFVSFLLMTVQFLLILTATAVLILVYSNTYMKEKALNETSAKTIEVQYRQQLYALDSMETLVTRLKSERHDFNHHLGVIYGLFQSGETDKAGEYTAKLVKTAEEYQNLVNIPYPALRAILNYKLAAAREEGIDLLLDVEIPPGLDLNEFDMAVIFGNLLDNAVEANRPVEAGRRAISLQISYKPDYLLIHTENPYDDAPGTEPHGKRTMKQEAENHGFGLQNIAYLINKHSGFMNITRESGVFKAELALNAEKIPD